MSCETEKLVIELVRDIANIDEVRSIGYSGSGRLPSKSSDGDIDIFIYCNSIPLLEKRQAVLGQMQELCSGARVNAFQGGRWGTGDFAAINGIETWMMYFTKDEALDEVEAILRGDRPDREDNYYYPPGRLAMLKGINILADKDGFLGALKARLETYPLSLAEKLIRYHLEKLEDIEDLERAVTRRDTLFYHFAIDIAIDHFLQALFAMNRTFFPSRKRTLQYIDGFGVKPHECCGRLLEVVRTGGSPESIEESYALWKGLVRELTNLA